MSAPSMIGYPHRSSSMRSGSISAQTPRPSHDDRVDHQLQAPTAHALLTSLLLAVRPDNGEHPRRPRLGAGPSALVRCHLVGEHAQPGPHEPGHAVGVAAGAPPLHQAADLEDAVEVGPTRAAVGQPVHGRRPTRPGRGRTGRTGRRPAPPCTARRRPSRPVGRRHEAAARSPRRRRAFAPARRAAFSDTGSSAKTCGETQPPP